jgi:hypothetical protein
MEENGGARKRQRMLSITRLEVMKADFCLCEGFCQGVSMPLKRGGEVGLVLLKAEFGCTVVHQCGNLLAVTSCASHLNVWRILHRVVDMSRTSVPAQLVLCPWRISQHVHLARSVELDKCAASNHTKVTMK